MLLSKIPVSAVFPSRASLPIVCHASIYTMSQKICAFLFLTELHQISMNFCMFW